MDAQNNREKVLLMMTEDMAQQLNEIHEAGSRCKHLQAEYLIAKEVASDAKKEWEAACDRLQELSCRWQDSEEVAARPLIAAVEAKAEKSSPVDPFVEGLGQQARDAVDAFDRILTEHGAVDVTKEVTNGLAKLKGNRRARAENPA